MNTSFPYSTPLSEKKSEPRIHNPNSKESPNTLSTPAARLWRPAAQRNLRNQWSKLFLYRKQWNSLSSNGRSLATSIINAHLSLRYVPAMDLGVISDMPEIRNRACEKLARQQGLGQRNLLSSYKDMVNIVSHMTNACGSMRCFVKELSGSPILKFSLQQEDESEKGDGDGDGVPVFSSMPVLSFESLAQEILRMFSMELCLKRLIVLELLSIHCKDTSGEEIHRLKWLDEFYHGEFDDLSLIGVYSEETSQPYLPGIRNWGLDLHAIKSDHDNPLLSREVLQVYLTAWLAEVNIDTCRIDEIFSLIESEMNVKFS